MTFLQPLWLALLGLAIPLVLWHGRSRASQTIPSLWLWRAIADTSPPTTRHRRRPVLTTSLLLQLAALLALALSLAGPRFQTRIPDHVVVVADRSSSMGARTNDGRTRWDLAAAAVRAHLKGLDPSDRGGPVVSLLSVGDDVRFEAVVAGDARAAMRALNHIELSQSPGAAAWSDVAVAIRRITRPQERTQVVVATDGQAAERAEEALLDLEGANVVVSAVGPSVRGMGLSSVRAVPIEPRAGAWRLEGEIVSYPPENEAVVLSVAYEREGIPGEVALAEESVRRRGERTMFSVDVDVPAAGTLTLRLPPDPFPSDDVARVRLRSEPVRLRVVVVGDAPDSLVRAFEALPAASVERADAPIPSASFDLAIVSESLGERPARTVLWIAGATPDGVVPPRHDGASAPIIPANVHGWNALFDFHASVPIESHAVPRLPGAEVLLSYGGAPLLQVRNEPGALDVVAGWQLGTSSWSNELGFATFIADLARHAQPWHGSWTVARCIAGRRCATEPSSSAFTSIDGQATLPVVEGEGGSESDLTAGPNPQELGARPPARWIDRGLALLAAFLLCVDGLRVWWRARGTRSATATRKRLARILRIASASSLVLLALGVPAPSFARYERTVVVIDPLRWLDERPAMDRLLTGLPLARRAVVTTEDGGRLAARFGEPWQPSSTRSAAQGYDRTTVATLASSLLPQGGGRLVFAGAGIPDEADVLRPSRLIERGLRVDALAGLPWEADEAWVDGVSVPAVVRTGERIPVSVELAGPAAEAQTVDVRVDDRLAGRRTGTGVVEIATGAPGEREIRVEIAGGPAGLAENDHASVHLEVQSKGRIALVSRDGSSMDRLEARLDALGHEIVGWRAADVPYTSEGLSSVDVVALLDVPAVDLHGAQQEALEGWVRERGGGLLIAGAHHAFGPGGYLRTPLEELSPLSARIPGEQPKAALAFVLDRSGSMQQSVGGVSRLAITKEATAGAVELLHPESEVAVVVFDDVATTLVPLGPPTTVRERLAPLVAGGGTNLYPGLEAGLLELQRSGAEARHLIVMTDGLVQPAPFDDLVERIVGEGITVSTVAVGRGSDRQLLQRIARRGGGAFHATDDVRALPGILAQEALLLSGDPVREGTVRPNMISGTAAFVGDMPDRFPTVPVYTRTTLKPSADLHAAAPGGDPILASWRHGLGRVVAMTTPLSGPSAERWSALPFASTLTSRMLRWLVRPVQDPGVSLFLSQGEDTLEAIATVVTEDGLPFEGARLKVSAVSPEGRSLGPAFMGETSPGTYEASISAPSVGAYNVRVEPTDLRSTEAELEATGVHQLSAPASLLGRASDLARARALASSTGGTWYAAYPPPPTVRLNVSTRFGGSLFGLLALICGAAGLAVSDRRPRRHPVRTAARGTASA